jgi:BirA family biotin operon repressor/biotin-[acetyl-CoA-carboxylase] ligase
MDLTRLSHSLLEPSGGYAVVEVHEHLTSTNTRAAELGLPYAVVLAEQQSAGRGRLDRRWESPAMAGITMSVTFPLDADLSSQAGWLPLVTGLVVAEAISEVTGVAATLKWPNDVLLPADDDRKVCGVLCEIVPMKPSVENALGGPPRPLVPVVPLVVVGIGLNVDQSRAELPVTTGTSLRLACGEELSAMRVDLVEAIARGLLDRLARVRAGGTAAEAVRAAYRSRCVTVGSESTVSLPGGVVIRGRVTDITVDGELVLHTAHGVKTLSAGDVTHVRPGDPTGRGLA